jgi:ferredoxin
MARPTWFVSLIKRAFPGRFLLARMTRLPVIGALIDRAIFWGDDIVYLPKNTLIQIDQPVESGSDVALPSQIVEHFIERANVHWVMDRCICRDASRCEDYPIDLGCLFLGEAALGINPRLGRQVTKAEALEHVRRCRDAGLVHMVGRNKLDAVWLGVGPGDKLLTVCNCCPCCCLWRVLPHLDPSIGRKVGRMPGVTFTVTERCVGCGTCTRGVCFAGALRLEGGRAVISDACRGCGRCAEVCPQQAIEFSYDGASSVQEVIGRITPLVDVS